MPSNSHPAAGVKYWGGAAASVAVAMDVPAVGGPTSGHTCVSSISAVVAVT